MAFARTWTSALHAATRSRVVAVGSRSHDRARTFADEFGIDQAYDDYESLVNDPGVDAVYAAFS
ncbi:MAG: Gfo/Idh/MocA family oxidoreductase [Nocardioidaceae bacterium]